MLGVHRESKGGEVGMTKLDKVVKGLECCYADGMAQNCEECPYAEEDGTCYRIDSLLRDALVLLKAQEPAMVEPKRIELADETKAWLDEMDAVDALGNIADICIDWDGYRTADGLGGLINEIWAYARYCADRLEKAQEPEALDAPKPDSDIGCWYDITHNYTLEQVVNALKAQEPVEPRIVDTSNSKLYHNDMFKNHYCGNCGEFLHVVNRKDLFCSQCGRAVKWDD